MLVFRLTPIETRFIPAATGWQRLGLAQLDPHLQPVPTLVVLEDIDLIGGHRRAGVIIEITYPDRAMATRNRRAIGISNGHGCFPVFALVLAPIDLA